MREEAVPVPVKLLKELDWLLIGSAFLLTAIGALLIFSAQHAMPEARDRVLWSRQLLWWAVASAAFLAAVWLPLRLHEVFAYIYLIGVGLALLALITLGIGTSGQWISLGPAYIQPSEPAKLALLLALSRYLAYLKRPVITPRPLLVLAAIIVPIWFLVVKQPDLGTSLVFWALLLVMLFWAGAPLPALFLLISPALSLILAFNWVVWTVFFVALLAILYYERPRLPISVGVVTLNLVFGIVTPLLLSRLMPYQKMRIQVLLHTGMDPRGAG